MAKNKIQFTNYVKNTESGRKKREEAAKKSEFKHHEVFDTPEDLLKKITSKEPVVKRKSVKSNKPSKPKKEKIDHEKIHVSPVNVTLTDENEIKKKLLMLEGMQQKIFFGLLKMAYSNNDKIVKEISSDQLQALSETSYGSTKTSLIRLIKKGLLQRHKGKTSYNGYHSLGFSDVVYKLSIEMAKNMGVIELKVEKEAEPA